VLAHEYRVDRLVSVRQLYWDDASLGLMEQPLAQMLHVISASLALQLAEKRTHQTRPS
jgi:hypothetical protein